jgi:hypothetical protein
MQRRRLVKFRRDFEQALLALGHAQDRLARDPHNVVKDEEMDRAADAEEGARRRFMFALLRAAPTAGKDPQ